MGLLGCCKCYGVVKYQSTVLPRFTTVNLTRWMVNATIMSIISIMLPIWWSQWPRWRWILGTWFQERCTHGCDITFQRKLTDSFMQSNLSRGYYYIHHFQEHPEQYWFDVSENNWVKQLCQTMCLGPKEPSFFFKFCCYHFSWILLQFDLSQSVRTPAIVTSPGFFCNDGTMKVVHNGTEGLLTMWILWCFWYWSLSLGKLHVVKSYLLYLSSISFSKATMLQCQGRLHSWHSSPQTRFHSNLQIPTSLLNPYNLLLQYLACSSLQLVCGCPCHHGGSSFE